MSVERIKEGLEAAVRSLAPDRSASRRDHDPEACPVGRICDMFT